MVRASELMRTLQRGGHASTLAKAIRPGGHIFIYTRTLDQNAQTIWGRRFPGFLKKETRLYRATNMQDWVRRADGLEVVATQRFRFRRVTDLDRLLAKARSKHYSTFSLYSTEEFAESLRGFEDNVRRHFDDLDKIEWWAKNLMLVVRRTDA